MVQEVRAQIRAGRRRAGRAVRCENNRDRLGEAPAVLKVRRRRDVHNQCRATMRLLTVVGAICQCRNHGENEASDCPKLAPSGGGNLGHDPAQRVVVLQRESGTSFAPFH